MKLDLVEMFEEMYGIKLKWYQKIWIKMYERSMNNKDVPLRYRFMKWKMLMGYRALDSIKPIIDYTYVTPKDSHGNILIAFVAGVTCAITIDSKKLLKVFFNEEIIDNAKITIE